MHRIILAFLILGLAAAMPAAATPTARDLGQGWSFRLDPQDPMAKDHQEEAKWRPAVVPGTVQTDLLAQGRIADPFYRDNEAGLQWIGLADWIYRTNIEIDEATLRRDHVELVFDGLDTFAEIRVNGTELLAADNMFRRWRVPAKASLRKGANELTVTLRSPIKRLLPWLLQQPYALPGEFDSAFGDEPPGKQTSAYLRKANYQYGWDWGPRFVTLGIWRPARIEAWDDARIEDFHIAQQRVGTDSAALSAEVEVSADRVRAVEVTIETSGPEGALPPVVLATMLDPGTNHIALPIRIDHPKLWYPIGYGPQDLYQFHVTVRNGQQILDQAVKRTGLRNVQIRREKDRWGKSFEFVVNGVPIFAKGANLIPFDSFPSRVTSERLREMLLAAKDGNMNMLRLWGGGHYQNDEFYALADELGVMIWQDFMFGGAITPYDTAFRENSRQEAVEQVKRLRDHPSIVLWCGNNEVQTGWESWPDRQDFKNAISPAERERIVTGMTTLFGDVLRGVVSKYAPEVPYWATTPGTDFDGPADRMDDGDAHYWKVWSGSAPLEAYLATTPRFQSEYGLQSFPVMRTVQAFAAPGDMAPNSPVMRAHQKFANGNGNDRLLFYIRGYYGEPRDFAAFVYLSQVMQAEGIELAATHLRAERPHSMGSLYWQLNDVWPGASWSSIDYFGRWKALQFHARRFYAPVLLAAQRSEGVTRLHVISDRVEPFDAEWRVRVMDFEGKILQQRTAPVHVAPLASTALPSLDDQALLQGAAPERSVAVFELIEKGRVLSRSQVYFARAKAIAWPNPGIAADLQPAGGGYRLTLTAKNLARAVWLEFGDIDATLSDNAFDILPGETVSIEVSSPADLDSLRRKLSIQSLAGATSGSLP